MTPLAAIAFELADCFLAVEQQNHANLVDAIEGARSALLGEEATLDVRSAEIRRQHGLGEIDDNAATRELWLIDKERREIVAERNELDQLREAWRSGRPDRELDELLAAGFAEERAKRERERERDIKEAREAGALKTPPPTWAPVTDEEIAEWRSACRSTSRRAANG